ncbi:prolyl oligopeptidase family serine peptidase [Shouchella clausii]|uniref:Peptidase n=1 Tax=Shouchella clausii TaxID=79880 RepID=A0A268S046_SHOCL|nr:prolyl oligopeptidase family serine peptidase [Shouchella clausii]PAD44130.1 hypothetical protein CHH54_03905 [Bacillus sp. 7520-S]MBU8595914.1 prolyl oligopeptidase family serine peptidase [Shouchella clausii]MCY1103097.1 prolyl oligopeptidase family serine peptidase [Shouchella clausii]MEB5478079.1 PHB depolymerase family esterase [Shouchella clausii]MED4157581.1 PHB depolymerase family esterase [Shouchella clausii]
MHVKKGKLVIVIVAASAVVAVLFLINKMNESESSIAGVDLLTEVTSTGEQVVGAAIEYTVPITSTNLSETSYSVQAIKGAHHISRNVEHVYVGQAPELGNPVSEGHYVIIEFSGNDLHGGTLSWNGSKYQSSRPTPMYRIKQVEAITTNEGQQLPPTSDEVVSTGERSPVVESFSYESYRNQAGATLPYRLYEPNQEEGERYPLVLFLHGGGERGNDNQIHLLGSEGGVAFARPDVQEQHPSFVVAPQAPYDPSVPLLEGWTTEPTYSMVLELVELMKERYPIDPDRIYIHGMSMGGIGTWNFIETNPDLFAGAIAICGYGHPERAKAIKDVPIWAFHGEDDKIIDVSGSRLMVEALEKVGGHIRYTEYKTGELRSPHSAWGPVYEDKQVIEWLYAQTRSN